jgi:hypothetical protein
MVAYLGGPFPINSKLGGLPMTNQESETANKTEYLKAHIHDAAASGGAGIVIFAIIVAAQIIVAALGVALWLIKTLWAIV